MRKRQGRKKQLSSDIYEPENRPEVKIGENHQADLPPFRIRNLYQPTTSREEPEDFLMWTPYVLPETVVEAYLEKDRVKKDNESTNIIPDDEDALNDLHKCDYNVEQAEELRARKKMLKTKEDSETFNNDEKDLFEKGLVEFRKNFTKIKNKYLPHRTLAELVSYFYRRKFTKNVRTCKLKNIQEHEKVQTEESEKKEQRTAKRRLEVKIGENHQADLPAFRIRNLYQPSTSREEPEGFLLWDPYVLPEAVVEAYLEKNRVKKDNDSPNIIPDDEDALTDLHICDYDIEQAEALRAHKKMIQAEENSDTFTEVERELFEKGLVDFRKNLIKIREKYLPNRTLAELVLHYYRRKTGRKIRPCKLKSLQKQILVQKEAAERKERRKAKRVSKANRKK